MKETLGIFKEIRLLLDTNMNVLTKQSRSHLERRISYGGRRMAAHCVGKFNATQRCDFSFFTHDKLETFSFLHEDQEDSSFCVGVGVRYYYNLQLHTFMKIQIATKEINYGYWIFMLLETIFREKEKLDIKSCVAPDNCWYYWWNESGLKMVFTFFRGENFHPNEVQ